MTEIHEGTTEPTSATPAPEPEPEPWFRRPRILAVAAGVLLLAGVIGAAALSGSGDGDQLAEGGLPIADDLGADVDGGVNGIAEGEPTPDDFGNTQVTSCVELYSPETLANREYAFDGTVTTVDGPLMTFEVNEWFTADQGPTITLDHQGYQGMLFAPDGPTLDTATRVLIAGDGGLVWSCGFTQLYDDATAQTWREALAG